MRALPALAIFIICVATPCAAQQKSRMKLERLTPLYQKEYTAAQVDIGGEKKTVASSGCGAVCLAMCGAYLIGDFSATPETLFVWAYDNGWYTGNGLNWEAMSAIAGAYGMRAEWVGREASAIRRALLFARPVIARMGPGVFTRRGHYVLLRGLDDDGNVLVSDPASPERSERAYPMKTILANAREENSFAILYAD